jgi:hypothetical protein
MASSFSPGRWSSPDLLGSLAIMMAKSDAQERFDFLALSLDVG